MEKLIKLEKILHRFENVFAPYVVSKLDSSSDIDRELISSMVNLFPEKIEFYDTNAKDTGAEFTKAIGLVEKFLDIYNQIESKYLDTGNPESLKLFSQIRPNINQMRSILIDNTNMNKSNDEGFLESIKFIGVVVIDGTENDLPNEEIAIQKFENEYKIKYDPKKYSIVYLPTDSLENLRYAIFEISQ